MSSSSRFSFCGGSHSLPYFLVPTSHSSSVHPWPSTSSLKHTLLPTGSHAAPFAAEPRNLVWSLSSTSLGLLTAPCPAPQLLPPALAVFSPTLSFLPPPPLLPHSPRTGGKEKRRRINVHRAPALCKMPCWVLPHTSRPLMCIST